MVSCDDCNMWMPTRCALYLRGVHTSFSCHNYKYMSTAGSTLLVGASLVAELLAALPTHRRRWAEVPLPARVHVHGRTDAGLFYRFPPSPPRCGIASATSQIGSQDEGKRVALLFLNVATKMTTLGWRATTQTPGLVSCR
jgi:hypothetical protein